MSSPIGHSLAALTIAMSLTQNSHRSTWLRFIWSLWLIVIALTPDLDRFLPFFSPTAHNGLRVTHSIFFSQTLPLVTIIILYFSGIRKQVWRDLSSQAILAGLSQIVLDMLVGVFPLPLFWPVSSQTFRLPFGVLPSAGALSFTNYYFYRNLLIELGVLGPIALLIFWHQHPNRRPKFYQRMTIILLTISILSMIIAFNLTR